MGLVTTLSINDIQQNINECHNAECRNAERHYYLDVMLSVVMLNVFTLRVIMLNRSAL
jgi:hypothetical protein